MGQGLRAADTDGDGRLSRAEFARFHERMFERMPKDADGQVPLAEAMRYAGMHMGTTGPAPGRDARPRGPGPGGRERGSAMPAPMTPPPPSRPGQDAAANREAELGTRGSETEAAGSSTSAGSSTPSSSSPQEAKPGQARGQGQRHGHGQAQGQAL